ncbi:S1 RNA-binding domain-containing protein [Enterococcus sp.]|uniref:S1 RNA-binding domain-containing protein n=1 Tax=unclassified Enterococcus TaxID=2608891 RepID=UPI0037C148C1
MRIAAISLNELASGNQEENKAALASLDPASLADTLQVGKETIIDILKALMQPGRDMRDEMPAPLLRKDVLSMDDLLPGMELQGTVRNVIDFGAFVDIGVKQDGLVHLSKMSRSFVKHPKDVVAVGDVVTVWIEQVDRKKGRISLTMVDPVIQK